MGIRSWPKKYLGETFREGNLTYFYGSLRYQSDLGRVEKEIVNGNPQKAQ